MKVTRIFLSSEYPNLNSAKIEVEGLGEVEIKAQLPDDLMTQVHNFYINLLRERVAATQGA